MELSWGEIDYICDFYITFISFIFIGPFEIEIHLAVRFRAYALDMIFFKPLLIHFFFENLRIVLQRSKNLRMPHCMGVKTELSPSFGQYWYCLKEAPL